MSKLNENDLQKKTSQMEQHNQEMREKIVKATGEIND